MTHAAPAIHYDLNNLPASATGAVVAIGNFDGVHLGHQALIGQAATIARERNAPLAVLTFEPHPREFFAPDADPFRLTLLPAKARRMAKLGVGHIYALPFDAALAHMTADDFAQKLLKDRLQSAHVVAGHDFTYGKGRVGKAQDLAQYFAATVVAPVCDLGGEVYSSTRARAALHDARFEDAAKILGRLWEVEGKVVHGQKNGRALGYPTANQNIGRHLRPPYGVYAVDVKIEGETQWRRGAANFGIRPMFEVEEPLLETHIFDFDRDIYDNNMRVRFLRFLRPEMRFDSLDALKIQMKQDCKDARL